MGKISFYKRKGVDAARTRGGVSKEKFLTHPNFEIVRQNLRDFKAVAQTVKSFRRSLSTVPKLRDGGLMNRLTKVLRIINKRSGGRKGERPVLLSQHRSLLTGLDLNASVEFLTTFPVAFTASHAATRNSATIQVQEQPVDEMIIAPPTATHFKLVQLLGTVRCR